MKELTKEQFAEQTGISDPECFARYQQQLQYYHPSDIVVEREAAIARARGIFRDFVPGNDVSTMFDLYQRVIAEHERPIHITKKDEKTRTPLTRHLHKYLPKCPACGLGKMEPFRVSEPKGRKNVHGWKVRWLCTRDECVHEKYSKQDFISTLNKLELIKYRALNPEEYRVYKARKTKPIIPVDVTERKRKPCCGKAK